MTVTAIFIEPEKNSSLSLGIDLPVIDVNQFAERTLFRRRVLVSVNEKPQLFLNIYAALDTDGWILEQCFKEIKVNQSTVAILHGMHVHLFDVETHNVTSISLDDYVGNLYSIPDVYSDELTENFIVTTFEYTFFINIKTGIKWRSEPCAVDGVNIHDINENIISGSGDWEPPSSDWVPFTLDLNTGRFIVKPVYQYM
ncbi:hypothetical protein SOASR030_35390 [Leminorella grimontii]|uniref:Uncharacterized protein n=1 Tax=Leminorella grimontii TaxID=82981 RepID=A0AAV5N6L1_9GAMM|nr:hypothetical protein [Leminorella grimontii]KFC94408.1 hypothetical protein GLGR_2755 [Leminorella grimontii ATCC 33999 = DSM 5078]GKX57427.1 hypothetical protein SOASR030_35390 [Leminorella grimontii]VFS54622.1 Uncharacterised protein [Leminorella grimontii]